MADFEAEIEQNMGEETSADINMFGAEVATIDITNGENGEHGENGMLFH
jgi:hypothetical protein